MITNLKSKLPHTSTTIFAVMSELAAEHNALNLAQGFPDFPADPALINLVDHYMKQGYNQYSPLAGVKPLREVLSEIIFNQTGHRYDADDELTITHGATQAISTAISATIREGDEVIIFTPAYDCYAPLVELNGGTPIYVQLEHPDYHINWEAFKKQLTHRTKMVILNTPHNPSATLIKKSDLEQLQELVKDSNILILSDEVYENIVFGGEEHHSVSQFPHLVERSFKIGSFGKTLHVTGWKLGYCAAPALLTQEFRKIHQYMIFSANCPMQLAMADYLADESHLQISGMYEHLRDVFLQSIAQSAFKPLTSHGSYFQLLDYSALSDKSEVDFAHELTIEHGVAAIPLSPFYHIPKEKKVLRFCFAKNEKTLHQAGSLLSKLS